MFIENTYSALQSLNKVKFLFSCQCVFCECQTDALESSSKMLQFTVPVNSNPSRDNMHSIEIT